MARTPDRIRIRHARIDGAVTAINDLALLNPELAAASREHWPQLWERIDALRRLIAEP